VSVGSLMAKVEYKAISSFLMDPIREPVMGLAQFEFTRPLYGNKDRVSHI
jgi:hypothetical protein